jgi:cyclophilin family peptidyl-prolyl cis-trans isomerase
MNTLPALLRAPLFAALFAPLFALLFAASPALAQNPMVEIKTNRGVIVAELYQDKSPKTVANFLEYAKSGFYSGTIFHRVIDGFMIQGGGFEHGMKEKRTTRPPIDNEATNRAANYAGTLAMARTSNPHSATAQFFINLKNNDFLNHRDTGQGYGYAVFGNVVKGMDVVNSIARVRTGSAGPHSDVPLEPVVIESVEIVSPRPAAKK